MNSTSTSVVLLSFLAFACGESARPTAAPVSSAAPTSSPVAAASIIQPDPSTAAPSSTAVASPDPPLPAASQTATAASEASSARPATTPRRAPVEAPITSVRVYVSNECPTKVDYCVADGTTLNTMLTQRASTIHTVRPGAKFMVRTGSSCGQPVFTAPASKDEVKFSICKK